MNISLVVPVYNEESVVEEFIRRTSAALSSFNDYELIFIDDGSTDSTYDLILNAIGDNQKIKCIKFSRNFGHQHAVLAGLTKSQYETIAVLDADLQDPPELLREMADKVVEGYEIVYGQRISRKGETFFKKMSAQTFYRILDFLTPIAIPKDTGDFRVISTRAAKMVVEMKEVDPFLRGLFAFTGLKSFAFPYVREERFAGSTKYTLKKMVNLATDAIYGFSSVPLKIFMRVSQFLLIAAIIFAIYAISRSLERGSGGGWLSIFSAVFFFGALNLSFLALIARYLISTLNAVQNRPSYVVEKYLNF
jgi:dolichol-phosphate mannosyltransferase